ncbi:MAG: ABC transporter substrate-binding protein [Solirubrobacterales bacterium]
MARQARRYFIPFLLVFILGFAVIRWQDLGQSVFSEMPENPFRIGVVGDASGIDPAQALSPGERLAASALYEPLLRYDGETGSLKPCLALNWGYSKDGMRVVFMLDRSVRFHNGRRLSAADVKRSWERSLKMDGGATRSRIMFDSIQGVGAFLSGKADHVSGIRARDNATLEIALGKPDAVFLQKTTHPIFWVLDTLDEGPVAPGTGPFRLISGDEKSSDLILIRNKTYHGPRPGLEALAFTWLSDSGKGIEAFGHGELDLVEGISAGEAARLRNDPAMGGKLVEKPIYGIYALGFRVQEYPFNDADFRRALSFSLDREGLAESVFAGMAIPSKGILPVNSPGYNKALQGYSYNPERGRELFVGTLFAGENNPRPIRLWYNEDAGHETLMKAIASQADVLGLGLNPIALSWPVYAKKLTQGELGFYRIGWEADYPDPDAFLYPLFHSRMRGVTNYTGYSNPRVDKLLDAARAQTHNTGKRIKLLRQAEQIIVDDAPMIWLFERKALFLIRPEVRGLTVNGMQYIDWTRLKQNP